MDQAIETRIWSPSSEQVQDLVVKSSAKASTIAALPLPLVDVAGLIYVQMNMVEDLAKLRGIEVTDRSKLLVSSIVTSVVSKVVSDAAISLAEATSIDQMLTATLVRASIAGFVTTITGEVYDLHFSEGGTTDDISYHTYLAYFNQQLRSDRLSIDHLSGHLIDSVTKRFGVA